ncbi:MAG TPA: trypsin-like serine protease [Myxococcales bacterium]|jgi:MYXO-CTERM domain-containing protein
MTRLRLLLVATLAFSLAACTKDASEPLRTRSARNAIVGGSKDTNPAHKAVVFIEILDSSHQPLGFCSGTLISPNVVLTAGHCVTDENSGALVSSTSRYGVFFDTDGDQVPDYPGDPCYFGGSQCSAAGNVTQVSRHPNYTVDSQYVPHNDIAYLKISSSAVPSGITPIPALTKALAAGNLKAGATVEFSGYGLQDHPDQYGTCNGYECPSGSLFHVSDTLDQVCASSSGCNGAPAGSIIYTGSAGPCSGDSGGPAFLTVSGQQYVAGVTSYGDASCMTDGVSTDVSYFESYVQGAVGTLAANGAACTSGSSCQSGVCVSGVCCDKGCSGTCQACTAALGATRDGTCTTVTGKVCDDGKACTENDKCQSNGSCAGTAKVCPGTAGPCTNAGACNASTGACTGGDNKANGTSCSDGNGCTQADTCQNGTCVGGSAINTCPAPSACKAASACNSTSGACDPFPNLQDGTACEDGNLCTTGDSCQSGSCASGTAKACPAPDACHGAGACNPATGTCTYGTLPNGATCDDHNACTANDQCVGGSCRGTVITGACAADACHAAGTCDPSNGLCSGTAMPDGTICNDGDSNTVNDQCLSGLCKGSPKGADPCFQKKDGSACNDGNACTLDDVCVGEICKGTNPKTCSAPDACHKVGQCDWQTGDCVYVAKANGTTCDDGDTSTINDACAAGKCIGEPTSSNGGADAGTALPQTQGCGCGSAGGASPVPMLLLAFGALALSRRRSRK